MSERRSRRKGWLGWIPYKATAAVLSFTAVGFILQAFIFKSWEMFLEMATWMKLGAVGYFGILLDLLVPSQFRRLRRSIEDGRLRLPWTLGAIFLQVGFFVLAYGVTGNLAYFKDVTSWYLVFILTLLIGMIDLLLGHEKTVEKLEPLVRKVDENAEHATTTLKALNRNTTGIYRAFKSAAEADRPVRALAMKCLAQVKALIPDIKGSSVIIDDYSLAIRCYNEFLRYYLAVAEKRSGEPIAIRAFYHNYVFDDWHTPRFESALDTLLTMTEKGIKIQFVLMAPNCPSTTAIIQLWNSVGITVYFLSFETAMSSMRDEEEERIISAGCPPWTWAGTETALKKLEVPIVFSWETERYLRREQRYFAGATIGYAPRRRVKEVFQDSWPLMTTRSYIEVFSPSSQP